MAKWNVRGAILANNHTLDFGRSALDTMKRDLENAGIRCICDGECVDFGPFRLGAASDVMNSPDRQSTSSHGSCLTMERRRAGCPRHGGPRISRGSSFIHVFPLWAGNTPTSPEAVNARWPMGGRGRSRTCVRLSSPPAFAGMGKFRCFPARYSLGNLLFDQADPQNTGGLVDVRFFRQGTWTAR